MYPCYIADNVKKNGRHLPLVVQNTFQKLQARGQVRDGAGWHETAILDDHTRLRVLWPLDEKYTIWDTSYTPVVFRWHPVHGCEAWFIAEPATYDGQVMFYAPLGGHGGGDYAGCLADTRPATPEEYADLKLYLDAAYGYTLRVYRKYTPQIRALFIARYWELGKD